MQLDASLTTDTKQGKSVGLASNAWLKAAIEPRFRRLGIRTVAVTPNLGIQMGGVGARRGDGVRAKRLAAARRRLGRVRMARKRGARPSGLRKVVKQCLKPAVTYGHTVAALTPGHVRQLRTILSSGLPGQAQGQDQLLRLAIWGDDPQGECSAAPLVAWSTAI